MSESAYAAWVKALAVGDEVVVDGGGWGAIRRLASVERLTNTQVILAGNGGVFHRVGRYAGDERGEYRHRRLIEPTPAVRAEMQREADIDTGRSFSHWHALTGDEAAAIAALLTAAHKRMKREHAERTRA